MNYRQKTKQSTKHTITFSVNENPNIKNCKYKRVVYVMNNLIEDLDKRLTDMLGINCIGRCKEKNTNEKFMDDLVMKKY